MTPIDRFERQLPTALTDLADPRTPDYLIDILGQTARTRQRPAWASLERWISMPGFLSPRLAAIVVVGVLVLAGLGGALIGGGGSPGPTSTPSPTPNASGAAPAAGLGYPLLGRWLSSPRTLAGLDPLAGTSILFTETTNRGPASAEIHTRLALSQSNDNGTVVLSATAEGDPSRVETLITRSTGAPGACAPGVFGVYPWSLSPGGKTLTIGPPDGTDCAARASTLPGIWTWMGCENPENNCFGELEAGEHASHFFAPFILPDQSWFADYGQLTYTVPDGWASTADWPSSYDLVPSAQDGGIHLFARPVAVATQTADCKTVANEAIGRTAADLVAFLATHPALDVTTPTSITIGKHGGMMVDVALSPDWTASCPGETAPLAVVLKESSKGEWDWGIATGTSDRLILLDLGPDQVVLIDVSAPEADFNAFVADAMPIVESFVFE